MSFRQLGKAFPRHLPGRRLLTQVNLKWVVIVVVLIVVLLVMRERREAGDCHCQLLSEFGYN